MMRGQYFSFDAIIATVIMAIATTSLVAYWFGVQAVVESRANPLHSEAMRIAESLMSPGVPANWQNAHLSDPFTGTYQFGLTNNYTNELNWSKIERLVTITNPASPADYVSAGRIMKAPAHYYILIEQVADCTGGCSRIEIGNESAQYAGEVAVAHRAAVLGGKPYRMRVFLGR